MKGSSRYDYLGHTTIFLRNKEYERHQKKLEEIKFTNKLKGTYYNKQHIEGIRVHNNIKVNCNKYKDKQKNDELQQCNNKILKKIIDISKHENKMNMTHISPRRQNFEEIDKIIRQNQMLSDKINNVDSGLNKNKIANNYHLLAECKKRIQRFEVIDYDRNQVKLKAQEVANSTSNGHLQTHSCQSYRMTSTNFRNSMTKEEMFRNHDQSQGDQFQQYDKIYLKSQQNTQSPSIKHNQTTQNTPRGQSYDVGRINSYELEKQTFYKKQQYLKNLRYGQKSQGNQEQLDSLNSSKIYFVKILYSNFISTSSGFGVHKQVHTSTNTKYRNFSRGNPQSADKIEQHSKNCSDVKVPANKQFRNYKKVIPFRQSLNMSYNATNHDRSQMSNDNSFNKFVESQLEQNCELSSQKREGQQYSEEEYGYGDEEQNYVKGESKQSSNRQHSQNSVDINRENQSRQRVISQSQSKNSEEKLAKIVSLTTKNQQRIQSANDNQNHINNQRNIHKNKNNQYKHLSQSIDRNTVDQQKIIDNSTYSLTNKNERESIISQNSQQKQSADKNENKIGYSNQKENLNYKTQSQQKNQQNNQSGNQLQNGSQNKLNKTHEENKDEYNNKEYEDYEQQYEQDDEDFVQSENEQINEETQKKFQNNCKDFYKDKANEKFQIAEQDEYEEDFESQVIQPQNKQNNNKNNTKNNSSHNNQFNVSSELSNSELKSKEQLNKQDDLAVSNQYQMTSSNDQSEMVLTKFNNSSKFNIKDESKQHSQIKKVTNNSKIITDNSKTITDKSLKINKQDIDESANEYDYENFEPENP